MTISSNPFLRLRSISDRMRVIRDQLDSVRDRYSPNIESAWLRVAISLAITVVAALAFARYRITFGAERFQLFGFPAVVLSAWLGRFLGGCTATASWALIASYWFLKPLGTLRIERSDDVHALVLFLVTGVAISFLFEGLSTARRRLDRLSQQRHEIAEELLLEKNRLEILLDNLPGLVWEIRCDADRWPPRVDFVSPNAWRLTGYFPDAWRNPQTLWEVLLPEDQRVGFESAVRAALAKGSASLRHRWRHAEGHLLSFETHLRARPATAGWSHEVRCVSLDITELEVAGRALAESERRFREAADRAPMMMWIAHPERGNLWCNRAWIDFRGRTLDEETGHGWRDGVHPEDLPGFAGQVGQAYERREEVKSEFRMRRADGVWRWVLSVGVPRHDGQGRFQDYLGFCVDVSERKQLDLDREELLRATEGAREAAELATRSKDEFLAKVSHELRNPLNGILGWVQVLAAPETSEDELRHGVALIDTSARTLARLVDDLLDLSRILAGKLSLSLAPTRLESVIAAACEEIRPTAAAKGVTLECHVEEPLPLLLGDVTRLHQVLWNLLANAVKFTPHGGRVDLTARPVDSDAGSAVSVSVRDDGAGIEAAFLPHVFAPFRQADGGAARAQQGLGLGLSIVSQIIARHGGQITVTSEGPGTGACFTVVLPVAEPPAEEVAERPQSGARLDELRVLVVDDDPVAREVVRTVLSRAGARVAEASSTAEALSEISRAAPNVVVSDVEMPGEDGLSLMRRLRSRPVADGGSIPAIALTAYALPADRQAALEAGYQEHLAKPIDTAHLVEVVRRLGRPSPR
jgi:PAS domain S-box-containing protein